MKLSPQQISIDGGTQPRAELNIRVKAALTHPRHQNLSDSAIADHVGARRETVLKYRHEMDAHLLETNKSNRRDSESDLSKTNKSTPRTGRDGRTINTVRIVRKSSSSSAKGNGRTQRKTVWKYRREMGASTEIPQMCTRTDIRRHRASWA